MKKIAPEAIPDNLIKAVADWMLIAAGTPEKYNMMTASWGGFGYLWNRPTATVYVRPQRYTYEFMERAERFSLTFFDGHYHEALALCGSCSGRQVDKVQASGLTPFFTEAGTPAFREARMILECRTCYSQMILPEGFVDASLIGKYYPQADFHRQYIAEIENVWIADEPLR